jgi:hypothetical protein
MTTEINRSESAEWALACDELGSKLVDETQKALSDSAGRGFFAPTGATLETILDFSQKTKEKMVEINGKIYERRRKVIFDQQEFALKILVQVAKLAFEAYREAIFNALALEQAEQAADAERDIADVNRLNAETEKRQVAIIQAKAELERRITVYRAQLVETETETMTFERLLIKAQLETAEKKLEIIDSLYKVLAAEELVLAAEQRRAASLELLLEAQRTLAAIKEEMVPYYLDKAKARGELAVAVTEDAAVREEIEKLGYDRLELKAAEEEADHQVREANEVYELAQDAQVRATEATKMARAQASRILQEYANEIQTSILAKRLALEKEGIDLKLNTSLSRLSIGLADDIEVIERERANLSLELANILENLAEQANSAAETIRYSATQQGKSCTDAYTSLRIREGFIAGFSGGGGTFGAA